MYLSPAGDEAKSAPSTSRGSSSEKPSTSGTPTKPIWKMRNKYGRGSRHRAKQERHPSICSDSETESSVIGTGVAGNSTIYFILYFISFYILFHFMHFIINC